MRTIGLVILILSVISTAYLLFRTSAELTRIRLFSLLSIVVGALLFFADHVTSFKIWGLSAALHRADASVSRIEAIEDEMRQQKQRSDLIVKDLQKSREEARAAVADLRAASDFELLLSQASNDDRAAFDKLVAIWSDKHSPRAGIAGQAIQKIVLELDPLGKFRFELPYPWKKAGVDPAAAPFEKFVELYQNSPAAVRIGLLSSLLEQKRFPQRDLLQFVANVIRDDSSLNTAAFACRAMEQQARLQKSIVNAADYLAWWDENKARY
jgi:hypothetical protein